MDFEALFWGHSQGQAVCVICSTCALSAVHAPRVIHVLHALRPNPFCVGQVIADSFLVFYCKWMTQEPLTYLYHLFSVVPHSSATAATLLNPEQWTRLSTSISASNVLKICVEPSRVTLLMQRVLPAKMGPPPSRSSGGHKEQTNRQDHQVHNVGHLADVRHFAVTRHVTKKDTLRILTTSPRLDMSLTSDTLLMSYTLLTTGMFQHRMCRKHQTCFRCRQSVDDMEHLATNKPFWFSNRG